jgi:hypothetical protein
LAKLYRLAILNEPGRHRASLVCLNLVEHFHGLNDTEGIADVDLCPTSTKGLAPGDAAS